MDRRIRLGCVEFLNAVPLVYPLEYDMFPHPFEIHKDVPSALAKGLVEGKYDIALASTTALLGLGDEYSYIPGIGICSDGPVKSVLVYFVGDINRLQKLYLDPASLTGNLLSRIILEKKYGIKAALIKGEQVDPRALKDGEGCVLIGDKALTAYVGTCDRLDLGREWKELTGLPFVFGLWIGRKEFITDEARIPLYNSWIIGRSMVPRIISSLGHLPVKPDVALDYLERCVTYEITEDHETALDLFLNIARDYA